MNESIISDPTDDPTDESDSFSDQMSPIELQSCATPIDSTRPRTHQQIRGPTNLTTYESEIIEFQAVKPMSEES